MPIFWWSHRGHYKRYLLYPLSAEIIYFGQFQLSAKMALFQIGPFGIDRTSFGQALLCSRPSRRRFCRGTRRPSKFFEPVSITVSEAATACYKELNNLSTTLFFDQTRPTGAQSPVILTRAEPAVLGVAMMSLCLGGFL